MKITSDDKSRVGKHVFELAELGMAPFRFTGFSEKVFKAGDTVKPAGTCNYCGTGIRFCCHIISADGKNFIVGTDCVNKTGDAGLVRAYKKSPEFRQMQRQIRHKRELDKIAEVKNLIDNHAETLAVISHPRGHRDRETYKLLTFLDYCNWYMENAGNAGKCALLKQIEEVLKGE